jgi:hypothetical protein
MFNFILEGKIGEYLAPMTQNSLFTAIQRNDQESIQNLIANASTIEICRNDDCGYSAIHMACRCNNLFALQLIFSRGVHCEQPDKNGSTPLHYASKYGHLELCKHLVERGALPAKKNTLNQTPYDLAESHVIRQYLLPLQFNAEVQQSEHHDVTMSYAPMQSNIPNYSQMGYPQQTGVDGGNNYFSGQAHMTTSALSFPPNQGTYQPPAPMPSNAFPVSPYQSAGPTHPSQSAVSSSGNKLIQAGP